MNSQHAKGRCEIKGVQHTDTARGHSTRTPRGQDQAQVKNWVQREHGSMEAWADKSVRALLTIVLDKVEHGLRGFHVHLALEIKVGHRLHKWARRGCQRNSGLTAPEDRRGSPGANLGARPAAVWSQQDGNPL